MSTHRGLKVWFPDFYTEAHRMEEDQTELVAALSYEGINCTKELDKDCEMIFCGSVFKSAHVAKESKKFPDIPIVHYNWDIYPFQVENNPELWQPYLQELKRAAEILVPSLCTVRRTIEYVGKTAVVVKAPIHPFETEVKTPGDFVMDPMRHYPDFGCGAVERACKQLGIPYLNDKTMSWTDYKKAIGNCRFIVSSYDEASTGSLSLLEAYWHGKTVLLSNSKWNGGYDYFGHRAIYFQFDSFDNLVSEIARLWHDTPTINVKNARNWILDNYTNKQFARGIADIMWGISC